MGNKMKEWFEANQEIYAEFKSKIHYTLDILSQDGTNVAKCDDTDSLQNMLLEARAAKNMPVENIINTFSKAAEEGDCLALIQVELRQSQGRESCDDEGYVWQPGAQRL